MQEERDKSKKGILSKMEISSVDIEDKRVSNIYKIRVLEKTRRLEYIKIARDIITKILSNLM